MIASGGSSTSAASIEPRISGQSSIPASRFARSRAALAVQAGLDPGEERQGPGQTNQVARRGPAGPDPGGQTFEVARLVERGPEVGAEAGIADHLGDGIVTPDDRGQVGQGGGQPIRQEPGTHRGAGPVDRLEERAFAAAFAKGPGQFQAPTGHLVERQDVLAVIRCEPGDMADGRLLGIAKIGDQSSSGLDLGAIVLDPRTPPGVAVPNCSLRIFRACSATKSQDGRVVTAIDDPARIERTQGVSSEVSEIRISDGSSRAISSTSSVRLTQVRENLPVESSTQASPSFPRTSTTANQVVRGFRVEKGVLGQCSRRDHPDDLALDDPFGESRVFHLLTDRRSDAGLHQLGEIRLERRVREARHLGCIRPLILVPGGDRQTKEGGGTIGIIAEHLVEVARSETGAMLQDRGP